MDGCALVVEWKYTEALYCFDLALKNDPVIIMPWMGKGASFEALEDWNNALECF